VGKTYRNAIKDRPRKKKQRALKRFMHKRKIQRELDDYENQKEMSTLPDDNLQTDG